MKSFPVFAFLLSACIPLSAAVVYSGPQSLSVDWDDLEGVYINVATGEIVNAWPDDFEEAPWINLTLGGFGIFNGDVLRPIATSAGAYDPELTTDFYLNLSPGTTIDISSPFVEQGWASVHHIGASGDPGKFVYGEAGYLGFEFEVGVNTYLGWLRMIPGNGEPGIIVDWAFNNSPGESIQAGAVPEPSSSVLVVCCALGSIVRRRR